VKLAVLCDDPAGPVVRHRVRALEPHLRAAGFDDVAYVAIPDHLVARLAVFRTLRDADVVLLARKLFTWAELRALRASARRLVFDFDDAVMFRDPFRGRPVSHVRRRRFRHAVRSADLVTAGNAYLLDLANEDAPKTTRLLAPTPVDTSRYAPGSSPHAGLRVGWIGSRATRAYLELVAPGLRRVREARPDAVVAVMADAPPSQLEGLAVEFTPWSEAGEVAFLRSLDVGLMPLTDDPFSRGKCGFKLLQYMACGVPAVASPVGVNVEIGDDGRAAALAATPDDWAPAILRVAADPDAARATADAARARVEERWSARALGPRFAEALAACAARRVPTA
jgi:glycosyltransferase involved in cell wall biosynthesis